MFGKALTRSLLLGGRHQIIRFPIYNTFESLLKTTFISKQISTTTAVSSKMVRVLNVAEKNDAAKSLANVLSQGQSRKREGFSKFNKIYEFESRLFNQQVNMTMTSVSGHLLSLDFAGHFKKWNTCNPVDLFMLPVEKFCSDNFKDIKRTLEREVKGCQTLIIWTDCDREGENIGFEIIEVCKAVKPNIKVYRATFSQITPQAVARAMNNLGPPDQRVNDAVDVRQELDLRIGAAFTRFQTKRLQRIFPAALAEQLVSYGSCQFPTLGFVVERYKQVQEFIPEPFWKLKVTHCHDDVKAEFSWHRHRLFNFSACQVLFDQCAENPIAEVIDIKSKNKSKWRPQALETVELEKLASRKLKISAKETMKIAEKLYTQGFISYPRTETNIFPKETDFDSMLREQTRDPEWGGFAQQVLENGPNPRNGSKTDKAHPPIHPLKYTDTLQGNEQKIYEFIVRHFLACVSMDAQGHETVVEIDIAGEKFSAQGLMILARNYLEVYPYEKWNAKEIPLYRIGDEFEPLSIDIVAGETSPPSLLTEADLIALMDKHGIGTDATHAEHIETIKSRMYVGLRPDGKIVPGHLGMGLVEGYDSMGFEMSKPHLRAELEADLKLICEGRKAREDVLQAQVQKYKEVFIEACHQAQKLDDALVPYLGEAQQITELESEHNVAVSSVIMDCPRCGRPMTLRTKKDGKGFYIGCSGYPDCRASLWLPDFVLNVKATSEICSICTHGSVAKLQFKFKPGSVPHSIPNNYVGCVGGCDEMLMESLGIRPISRQNQGNNNFTPYSQVTTLTPRNGPNSNQMGSGGDRGNRNSSNVLHDRRKGNSTPNSNSYHTWTSNSTRVTTARHTTPAPSQNSANNVWPRSNQQTRPGMPLSVTSSSVLPSPRGDKSRQQRNKSSQMSTSFGNDSRDGGMSRDKDIMCNCSRNALLLTVRKEGPNTGRQFYKCSSQSGEGCNFFLWADENDNSQDQTPSGSGGLGPTQGFFSRNNNSFKNKNSEPSSTNEVSCRCGLPARSLTVSKAGPNTGRPFYGCSKPREQSCNFFQWADEESSDSGWQNARRMLSNDNPSPFLPGPIGQKRSSTNSDVPKKRKPPKCGYCGQLGHRKNKCPEKTDDF